MKKMKRMKIKSGWLRFVAMTLTMILTLNVLITAFGVEVLADAIDGVIDAIKDAVTDTVTADRVQLKVTPLNSRKTDESNFCKAETRAYPKTGVVQFRVSVVIDGTDYGGKTLPDTIKLGENITFSYQTYDLSAISSAGDYTAISGTHTFTADSDTLYYDFSVAVGTADFGLYKLNADVQEYLWYLGDFVTYNGTTFDMLWELQQPLWLSADTTNYYSRTFGFEIYDLINASVYHTADASTGENIYYDSAIGTLAVKYCTSYVCCSEGCTLSYYYFVFNYWLGDISMTKGYATTEMFDIKQTSIGSAISNAVIQTGLGHYYASINGFHYGPDLSQNDSRVGLVYTGWQNAQSVVDRDTMIDLNCGVVTMRLDGYPASEYSDTSWWRAKNHWAKIKKGFLPVEGAMQYTYSNEDNYDEIEWGNAHTCQFEKYRTDYTAVGHRDCSYTGLGKDYYPEWGQETYAIKIEGDPNSIGIAAMRYGYGSSRVYKASRVYCSVRDDSPLEIVETYLEDTSKSVKSQDDTLHIAIRFNEPVQIDLKNTPELICGLNTANITSAQASNAVRFQYVCGAGSDTLVFSYDLKNLPSDKVIDQIQIYYMTNADTVCDFSSTDSIHICSKQGNTQTVVNGIDKANDIVTKESGTRWSVAKTYQGATDLLTAPALIGPITLKLTKTIDPRQPEIVSITDDNTGKTAKNHTATITLNVNGLDGKVYAHWTDNLNGLTDTEIPRPSTYSESEIVVATSSNARTYKTTAALEGMVYLWVKVVTSFGKVDERLCGPFYFDKSAESVTDIQVVNGSLASQSKKKTLQFTIDHTSDYLSCSGDKIFDDTQNSEVAFSKENIEIAELSLVYCEDTLWGSGSDITTKLLYNSVSNARHLTAKVTGTKEDYVYKFSTTGNIATDKTAQTTDNFIQKNADGSSKKVKYITKVTYQIDIGYDTESGYNDFDLETGDVEYKKVFIGFKTTDAAGNSKSPTSAAFEAGNDYVNDQYALFDIRSIKEAQIDYTGSTDALPTDKATGTVIDSSVNVFPTKTSMTATFRFSDDTRIMEKDLLTAGYEVRVYIKKPNSTIATDSTTDCMGHTLGTWGSTVKMLTTVNDGTTIKQVEVDKPGCFLGNVAVLLDGEGNTQEQYTSWFSWTLADKEGTGDATAYRSIVITGYEANALSDLCGYYEIYFSFKDTAGNVTYTPSATFIIGNGENETENIQNMTSGKVFTNDVFQLPEDSRYYYQTEDGVIQNPTYVSEGGKLTFSSEEIAEKYLLYKEYQDLYLYQIPSTTIADNLNSKGGSKTRSDADIAAGRKAEVGQWWIRYKMKTWSPGNTENTGAWIYYYYSDSSTTPTIDIDNLPAELYTALHTVVETIMSSGSNVLLAGEDNIDKYGSPNIPVTSIQYEPLSSETSLCHSQFTRTISFQGDAGIYQGTVFVDDDDVTKEYPLASTSLVTVSGRTRIYITPSTGIYAGIWGQVASGKDMLLKDVVNTIYKQILVSAGNDLANLGNVKAPSGCYTVLEISDNGYAMAEVYIDEDAPQLNFDYKVYDEDGKTSISSKHYTKADESGLVIHGVSFTLRGIGYYGAEGYYDNEIDDMAYVVVYNSTRVRTLYAMTVEDLRLENPTIDEEGIYYVEVWDRSGNYYTFTVELVSKPMSVSITTEDNGIIVRVSNREDTQISVYEVKRDGVTIDTSFAKTKTYSENGTYTIHIVDRFGGEYQSTGFKYTREIPPITWRSTEDERTVGEGTNSSTVADYTPYAKLVAVDSVTYNVVTSVPLSFRYSTALGIKVEFLGDTTEEDFSVNPSQYTTYTQKEMKNCQVKCSYKDHPNVYVIYNVIVDTVAPAIDVEYDHYSFENRAELDAALQLAEGDYVVGDVITPKRIDFSLLSAMTLKIASGASVYTSGARLSVNDSSGVSRLIIKLDNVTIYDGAYSEDGEYKDNDGNSVNYNILDEYGTYTISAFDALGNKTTFSFTNTPNSEVIYDVDGKTYPAFYDYVYETDAGGKIILDENGDPIVLEKWLFLKKFEENSEETVDDKYFDKSTKSSLGYFFRYGQEFKYMQYGNKSQSVTLTHNSDVQILLTYVDEIRAQVGSEEVLQEVDCYRFIGLKVQDGEIYLYQYVVDDADGEISIAEEVSEIPIVTLNELAVGNTKVIYHFDNAIESGYTSLGMYVTARYNKDGSVTIEVTAPTDNSVIVTSEFKVVQTDGAFEPSYFKTVLSLYESSVDICNEDGVIEIKEEELGVGQWKYANGDWLKVDLDSISDPYLTDVMISYSTTMTPGTYHYLYSTDSSVTVEEYFGEGEGYYFVKTVNIFGNEKIYRLAISNSLLVSTIAVYEDGWTRQFSTDETCDVNANKQVTVSFKQDEYIKYSVTKDGLVILPTKEEKSGSISLIFEEEGNYIVTVSDQYGNMVVRHIGIQKKTLNLPSNIILNPQTKALRYNENYTNMKVSVNQTLLSQYDISYIAVEKDDSETLVILDEISPAAQRVSMAEASFTECVGLAGDGDYTIVFRDTHGNMAKVEVHYRETPTLTLTRMTTRSEKAELYDLEKAFNPDINFISNNSLTFNTIAEKYVFTVSGETKDCPCTLSFKDDEIKGRVAYDITYIDEYGFSYQFTAVLYRTDIQLELDPSVQSGTVDGVLMTADNIRVVFSDEATCYYQSEGGEFVEFPKGSVLKKDGSYVIFAEDSAGNYSYFTVTKDSVVEYSFREGKYGKKIERGFVTNSDNVLFQAENGDTAEIKTVYLNGEKIDITEDDFNFQKNGKWDIVVTDKTGNESLFTFYVYTHEVNYLDFYAPQDYSFTDIWYVAGSGETGKISVNSGIVVEEDGSVHYCFNHAGSYIVVMNSDVTGTPITFTLDISETKPTATLNGVEDGGSTIDTITIANTQKEDTVYVYLNGSLTPSAVYEISYDGEKVEITEEGEYVVVVKNRAQNEVTYHFTRKHVANTAGSVLIILLMAVIVIGLFTGMTYRNKSKVDK